uniref:Deoxynucleoside kinase domain-containing protein n=1 Tax=Panagrolaimus sp. ES5 TaxID=591445 RepID=A0AC34F395_9BILA
MSKIAKELARTLKFRYIPDVQFDKLLVENINGTAHIRENSDKIEKMSQKCFVSRFDQYLNAFAHVLNTGQGVVLERSPFSDFVFTNALKAKDYIGIECKNFKHYYNFRKYTLAQIKFWPHAVFYINTPVEDFATFDSKFLSVIHDCYKDCINEFRRHSKILSYNSEKFVTSEAIIKHIESSDPDDIEWLNGDFLGYAAFVDDTNDPENSEVV